MACDETNLVPIATCPMPDHRVYAQAGRFGAHNIHENVPLPTAWRSDQIVLGTFFNGGLRAYDISNPYHAVDRHVGGLYVLEMDF